MDERKRLEMFSAPRRSPDYEDIMGISDLSPEEKDNYYAALEEIEKRAKQAQRAGILGDSINGL